MSLQLQIMGTRDPDVEWMERMGLDRDAPTMLSECQAPGALRPCPWIRCRHHILVEVSADTGTISIPRRGWQGASRSISPRSPAELVRGWINEAVELLLDMDESCSLDFEGRDQTLEQIGEHMNLTRERIRQIEAAGMRNWRDGARALNLELEPGPDTHRQGR